MSHNSLMSEHAPYAIFDALVHTLDSLGATHRPVALWFGPLWPSDLMSPYTRETAPLLQEWARRQNDLAYIAQAIEEGHTEALYWCADLFSQTYEAVQQERDAIEASCGVISIRNRDKKRVVVIIDTEKIEMGAIDRSILLNEDVRKTAPLLVMINHEDPNYLYLLSQLINEVVLSLRHIIVCMQAYALHAQPATFSKQVAVPRAYRVLAEQSSNATHINTAPLLASLSQYALVGLPAFSVAERATAAVVLGNSAYVPAWLQTMPVDEDVVYVPMFHTAYQLLVDALFKNTFKPSQANARHMQEESVMSITERLWVHTPDMHPFHVRQWHREDAVRLLNTLYATPVKNMLKTTATAWPRVRV